MNNIYDIHGIRLILDNEDCYKALEIVHKLWYEVPGKSKDYIANPKISGYQSLHTVVLMDGIVPLEAQIRTRQMHLQAEFGFAAHWRYKEGDCKHISFVLGMVKWARWVVSWQWPRVRGFHSIPYRYPFKEEPRVRLNHEPVLEPTCKLKMGDIVEFTPALPNKSLVECREEIQRMYDCGAAVSGSRSRSKTPAGWTT
ncbi:hypothetical protein MLD38_005187 [Melastoma candidum]|uniref:Uncharacterized protein n=1 Tax=Melastoma candidum TaxID=119954 RepID=A0ACB9SCX3_9MYRT|nr:hypothetical protein MLD38_005187 [Melastoma candidum]